MRLKGRFRLSYANVIASIALFIALTGTTYAASKITGKQIKNNTITSADIKNRTIRGNDLAKGLLTSSAAAPLARRRSRRPAMRDRSGSRPRATTRMWPASRWLPGRT